MAHRELAAEQAYVDRAYEALAEMRKRAERLRDSVLDQSGGGTHQARYERDVFVSTGLERLQQLEIGAEPLVFGRIDRTDDETFYIGRVAVAGPEREALVVDWRAPVAAPFYRATGLEPLGLERRRHFVAEGRKLLRIHDEHLVGETDDDRPGGTEALLYALERARTGRMRDIVATVQREQDEIIRAPLEGILIVQGGPGTGKTAVALHRAAYLLFTHRATLERDGVLVVGPNQLFLRYIEQVLPALGESGAALSTVDGLVDLVRPVAADPPPIARLKGDPRMARVVGNALRDRRRPLRRALTVDVNGREVRLTPRDSARIVTGGRRKRRPHNDVRRDVDRMVVERLYRAYQRTFGPEESVDIDERDFARELWESMDVRRALWWMWPRLDPHELVHDLLGSKALLASAGQGILSDDEIDLLHRPWSDHHGDAPWTSADLPLIDEARALVGPRRRRGTPEDEPDDYGHIVVDEAQDLSPMQLRTIGRRSRRGSLTLVGDIAQTTGATPPTSWEDVLEHLPSGRGVRTEKLSINYRTPAEIMRLAERVLEALPVDLAPPRSIRSTGTEPRFVETSADELPDRAAAAAWDELDAVDGGIVSVVCPPSLVSAVGDALAAAGVPHAEGREDLDAPVTLVTVDAVKGLEFDGVVVVEPAALVRESENGAHALYVALTRGTQRLTIVHAEPLPPELR